MLAARVSYRILWGFKGDASGSIVISYAVGQPGFGGTMDSESHLKSAGTLLSRVRAPPPAPWPDRAPET
ncbi:hypothetical protein PoB_000224500 [Plakobranchus ocellatus]|uniref:Uncharacterized protein n=1 Tax=Plakobranchus ocellatus TaxID=259542 RepID=A0AAV3XY46_9GAST|nr:hypothetical protein PoB_000224500 [Plakobranchus ocellatus]